MCNDPCKEDYRGIYPWSEPETRAIKELVTDIGPKIALYISVHNYLQGIMFPWGYTGHPPDDVNDLMSLASEAQTAVREKYGTKYRVGQIPTIDRLTPGCSVDWAKAEANIRFCYSFELPGPTYKFQVPPPHLLKIAEEFFEALKVFAEAVKQNKI
ncbi:hypothetical protein O3M35_002019 [Rhynocoris fuscipes]|uniref:Peptidase M14 domain-containing protein n=1 Tax=Rhynocoris fuscipes TaxID=488301 RepID=A0AAW1CQY8_9HEMI